LPGSDKNRYLGSRREHAMDEKRKWIVRGALALAVIGGGTGLAVASAGGEDQKLTGGALDRATAVALEHTGGGTVIEAEAGDDGTAYGIEIRLDDGSVVDVALDANFHVVRGASEDEGTAEEEDSVDQNGTDKD
jgi:hypothetical protein